MYPIDLYLLRHAQSEGNVANQRGHHGDASLFTPEFRARPARLWRLTDVGLQQAQMAGNWLKANGAAHAQCYISEFLRAKETWYHLDLPEARPPYVTMYLRERSWGDLERISPQEREAQFSQIMQWKQEDPFYWKPPNGEALYDVCLRREKMLDTWHRFQSAHPDTPVLSIEHAETMWSFLFLVTRMSVERYLELDRSTDTFDRIHNCQIWHFSRRNPEDASDIRNHLMWWRSICPWDMARSRNEWQLIERPKNTREHIRAEIEATPRLIHS